MPRPARPVPTQKLLQLAVAEDQVRLVCDELRGAAEKYRTVAVQLSGELEAERAGGGDVRTGALTVVKTLANADALERMATAIEEAWEAPGPGGYELVDMDALAALAERQAAAEALVDAELEPPEPDIVLAARAALGLVPPIHDPDDEVDDNEDLFAPEVDNAGGMPAGDAPVIP